MSFTAVSAIVATFHCITCKIISDDVIPNVTVIGALAKLMYLHLYANFITIVLTLILE